MRVAVVTLGVIVALARGEAAPAQSGGRPGAEGVDPRLRAEIVAARDRIWRAWFANDLPTLERMLPEDFVGIGWGDGPWENRDQTLAGAAEFAAGGGKLVRLEFPRDAMQVFGDVVVIYSEYLVELEVGGGRSTQTGRATEVFVRRGGIWQNPSWHLDSGR